MSTVDQSSPPSKRIRPNPPSEQFNGSSFETYNDQKSISEDVSFDQIIKMNFFLQFQIF